MAEVGIGVIGMGWMGTVHSRSYRAVADKFHESGLAPRLVICSDSVAARSQSAQERFGFERSSTDWRDVVDDPDVQVVSVTSPNFLHREMVLAAIQAGKHVMCEKPVGVLPTETAELYHAAKEAGVLTFTGLNYRWAPLVQYARDLIQQGRLGRITNYNGRFLTGYASDPLGVLSWRFQAERSGTGVLGDLMPHVADMAHFLVGPIERVFSTRQTIISERPLPVPGRGTHFSRGTPDDPTGPVTNEDYAVSLVEFANGARGTLELSRVVQGPKLQNSFEVYGTEGALRWDFENMDALELFLPDGTPERDGFVRLIAGPGFPFFETFQPGPGNNLSYDDLKVIEAYHVVKSVVEETQHEPSFAAAYAFANAMQAMMQSWDSGSWEEVRPL